MARKLCLWLVVFVCCRSIVVRLWPCCGLRVIDFSIGGYGIAAGFGIQERICWPLQPGAASRTVVQQSNIVQAAPSPTCLSQIFFNFASVCKLQVFVDEAEKLPVVLVRGVLGAVCCICVLPPSSAPSTLRCIATCIQVQLKREWRGRVSLPAGGGCFRHACQQ